MNQNYAIFLEVSIYSVTVLLNQVQLIGGRGKPINYFLCE